MKNKIFAYVCAIALVLSLLVIPSFALENDFTGDYEFAYVLDFYPLNINASYLDVRLSFICQGVEYDMISFVTNVNTGSTSMNYWTEGGTTTVYRSDTGWADDSYRFISINFLDTQSATTINFISFLLLNEYVPEPNYNGWYYDIYDSIRVAIFDDYEINGAQDMAITLVALVLSIVCILMPVLILFCIAKRILMSRYI